MSDNDSHGCQQVPAEDKLRILSTLNDDQISCSNGNDGCACGAYCNGLTARCRVDCIAGVEELPDSIPGCGDGQVCTSLGRCAASTDTPPPPVQALTLQISPLMISANTMSGAALVPITVSVTANSLDFIQPNHPAIVRYQFLSQTGQPPPPPGSTPRVKCAVNQELAGSCDLTGWHFSVGSGILVSDTQTIWVQLPQTTNATQWTLEGRSDWTLTPATAVVSAEPVAFPTTDPGHYTGTITWTNGGGGASDNQLLVPVEAIVTSSNVALYERSRILFPDGHAVFSRDAAKVTMVGWLSSSTARYDVKFGLTLGAYNTATGHLDGTGSYQTGALRQTPITLSLQRTGDIGAPSCPASGSCTTGSYCDAAMNLCLPGTGPAAGAGIVDGATATPATTLASTLVTAWNGSLSTLLSTNSAVLAGSTPREQFERPYCYQLPTQTTPSTFARENTLVSPSYDFTCNSDNSPQLTFPLANLQQEVSQGADGNTLILLNDCISDLDLQPTSARPTNNHCISLSRFLLALRPPQSEDWGYQMKHQLLRQWLTVNSYVAHTIVQDQPYEEALGATGQTPLTRLGQAADRMDENLALLLDVSARQYYAASNDLATQSITTPDYRMRPRPLARWTFNAPILGMFNLTDIPSTESAPPGSPLNTPIRCDTASLLNSAVSPGPCSGTLTNSGDSSYDIYTLTFSLGIEGTHISCQFCSDSFGIIRTYNGSSSGPPMDIRTRLYATYNVLDETITLIMDVDYQDPLVAGRITFPRIHKGSGNSGFGFLALEAKGGTYSLMQALPNQPVNIFTPTMIVATATLHSDGPPTIIHTPVGSLSAPLSRDFHLLEWFGTGSPNGKLDELSFWNRVLTLDEFTLMAVRYNWGPTNESLPPKLSFPLPSNEQAVALPAHMVEAANADLRLAQAYLAADANTIYQQCLAGQHAELDTALARVGRSLRTVSVIEDEAASVVSAVGTSTPWFTRYQADLTEFTGRRANLISTLTSLQRGECKNPLGISEEDLPLYVGSTGSSAAERFFAGSRFLANAALTEIGVAGGETGTDGLLAQARQAYNASRTSRFQEDQGAHDSAGRILKISTDYEDQLKRYCGAPDGEDVAHGVFLLLAGFQSGAFTASNCFFKTEIPACRNLADTPISSIPSSCLRGEMGERLLAIQAAGVDAQIAANTLDRVTDQFDAAVDYCARLKIELDGDVELLNKHQAHMWNLNLEKQAVRGSFLSRIFSIAAASTRGGGTGFLEFIGSHFSNDLHFIQEQNSYEVEKQARGNSEEMLACTQKADNEKFAIDAAADTIVRADQQTRAAALNFNDDANIVSALASEGAGQLTIESQIDRTPPHLHYWLDQSISSYHAHMAYARRLTYLSVRAYEYEAQQSSGLRGNVLNAQLPNDLKTVATAILGATAPFAGRGIDDGPLVLSLRDDILRIADLSQRSSRLDGTAPLTPTEAFRQLLTSDATKIYDVNGGYVGHGIRFSLRPGEVDAQTCAERLSRIKPSVTLDNASQQIVHTRLVLAATNTFGSQVCGANTSSGTLQLARVQPSQALLVGDAVPSFPNPSAFSTTGLFPLINSSLDTLRTMTFPGDDPSAFAGRGYFGDYILIFPDDPISCTPARCDGWSSDALQKVTDVLLRFDIVEQDNTHL